MDVASFISKWSKAELTERAASQEHFLDLCRLLAQPTPRKLLISRVSTGKLGIDIVQRYFSRYWLQEVAFHREQRTLFCADPSIRANS